MLHKRNLIFDGIALLVLLQATSLQALRPAWWPARTTTSPTTNTTSPTTTTTPRPSFCTNTSIVTKGLPLDLIFVLDESGSVGSNEYKDMINWVKSVLTNFRQDIDDGGVNVGVVMFASSSRVAITLGRRSYISLNNLISGISRRSGGTAIGKGMQSAMSQLASNGRAGVTQMMIVLTDGYGGSVKTESDNARNRGIVTVSVGVGNGVHDETLLTIAGEASRKFHVSNFHQLTHFVKKIQSMITTTVIQKMQHNCHPKARCMKDNNGNWVCVCLDGFVGNGYNCEEIYNVTCDQQYMSVRVLASYYTRVDIRLNQLHLNDHSCKGRIDPYDNKYWIFDVNSYQACGTKYSSNGSHFSYKNTLSNSIIDLELFAGAARIFNFACNFETSLNNISLVNTYYKVVKNVAVIHNPFGEGQFNAILNLFDDPNYTHQTQKKLYHARDTAYFRIKLGTNDTTINLILQRCWVTPTPAAYHIYQFVFIQNQCPVGQSSSDLMIRRSGRGPIATFQTKVFSYLSSERTYLHCSLRLCSSANGQNCVPGCVRNYGRKKRETDGKDVEDILSLGPFRVQRDIKQDNRKSESEQSEEKASLSLSSLLTNVVAVVSIIGFMGLMVIMILDRRSRKHQVNKIERVSG